MDRHSKGAYLLMYTLTIDNPAYEKGTEFQVPNFPVGITNGESVEVTKEQVENYEALTGNKFKEVAEGIAGATLTGSKTGGEKK